MVIATAGLSGVPAVAAPGSTYLPAIGPAPLRFLQLPTPVTNWVSDPAPLFPDLTPAVEEPSNAIPAIPAVAPVPTPDAITNTASSIAVTTEAAFTPIGSPDTISVISPQMLLRYFTPGTNSPAPAQPDAVGFTPPVSPASLPNSK